MPHVMIFTLIISAQLACPSNGSDTPDAGAKHDGPTGDGMIAGDGVTPDSGPKQPGVYLDPLGTDLVAIGHSLQLSAKVIDETGAVVSNPTLTWTSSDPNVLSVDDTGKMIGVTYGGGDAVAPDQTIYVTASYQGMTSEKLYVQVVIPDTGTGVEFVPVEMSDDTGLGKPGYEPTAAGRAHYDGLYTVDLAAGEVSACGLYVNNKWTGKTCTFNRADGRVYQKRKLQVLLKVFGTYGQFKKAHFEYPSVLDPSGATLMPPQPRQPYAEWSSSNAQVATIKNGVVEALGPGETEIKVTVGPQTFSIKLVVYGNFGYVPWENFKPGAVAEAGYLFLLSSSNGPAHLGTLDTIRTIDLNTFTNMDYRPSKYGPQGRRLIDRSDSGDPEAFGGGGCGLVWRDTDHVWVLSWDRALLFNVKTMQQAAGTNKVDWRDPADGTSDLPQRMCRAVSWTDPTTKKAFLIGFDQGDPAQPKPKYSVRVADVTNLQTANVIAKRLNVSPYNTSNTYYWPALRKAGTGNTVYYLAVTAGKARLQSATIEISGGSATLAATSTDIDAGDHDGDKTSSPSLLLAPFKAVDHAFIGSQKDVTAFNLDTQAPAAKLDIRWYGEKIRLMRLSPDGKTIYCVPSWQYPGLDENKVYRGKTVIEYKSSSGATKTTELTNHRIGLINIDSALAKPTLREDPATDPKQCFKISGSCTGWSDGMRFGIDLTHTQLKQWMLSSGLSDSALPPILGINVRDIAVGEKNLYLIGNDHPDGVGTALANLGDVAVFRLADGAGIVFRGWRSEPDALKGLSDPFGFRLGENDAVLGDYRAKNGAALFIAGSLPPEDKGDGPAEQPDNPRPETTNYANAPDPALEPGEVVLLSSSHQTYADGTLDVIRSVDTSIYAENDFDSSQAGPQGNALKFSSGTPLKGGCGFAAGPSGSVFVFNGLRAIQYDTVNHKVLNNGYSVIFGTDKELVCTGTYASVGGKTFLYGLDQTNKPAHPMYVADLSALGTGDVTAQALSDPFMNEMPNVDYAVRYVNALVRNDELYFIERNDPYADFRNVVHRAKIGADGSLTFDASRSSSIIGEYTGSGDPAFVIASFSGKDQLFIGNENSITVYDLSGTSPVRVNYNTDGDGLQDDLDTWRFGRGIQAFRLNPAKTKLFGLPWQKSEKLPKDQYKVPLLGGGTRDQDADRYRMVVIDLTGSASGRPEFDKATNGGNGIDLVYFYLKQHILTYEWSTALPPIFPYFRRDFAVSERSVFLIGNDAPDGAGSALANMTDLAIYDIKTGVGSILRNWTYQGINHASDPFGFKLGEGDVVLGTARAKNGAVLFVP
jgi:hypothetical protein